MNRWHILLYGRVQGVGFRAFAASRARQHGVRGEVRNTPDGAVEIVAEGEEATLEAFLEDVQRGPTLARVSEVDVRRDEGAARYRGFGITG